MLSWTDRNRSRDNSIFKDFLKTLIASNKRKNKNWKCSVKCGFSTNRWAQRVHCDIKGNRRLWAKILKPITSKFKNSQIECFTSYGKFPIKWMSADKLLHFFSSCFNTYIKHIWGIRLKELTKIWEKKILFLEGWKKSGTLFHLFNFLLSFWKLFGRF